MVKVLIVGAGIAGLTLAKLLSRANHDVLVIEKHKKIKHLGYVLGLWPNGVEMLRKIGIAKKIVSKSVIIEHQAMYLSSGALLKNFNFSKLNNKFGVLIEVEREVLYDELLRCNKATKIRFGTTVTSLRQRSQSVVVKLSNGADETFDYVIGADGVHSVIRDIIFPKLIKKPPRWKAWLSWIPRTDEKNTIKCMEGPRSFCGIYPTKKRGKSFCALFSTKLNDGADDFQVFRDMKGFTKDILDNSPKSLFSVSEVNVHCSRYFSGRVALIGDSLRTSLPIIGMGASMAMEDAYVFADELQKDQSPSFLVEFQNRRKKRYKHIQSISDSYLFFLSHAGKLNNFLLKIGSKLYGPLFVKRLEKMLHQQP